MSRESERKDEIIRGLQRDLEERTAWARSLDAEVAHRDATILRLLGVEHTKLTYRFQGRDFRLTDVHGNVVPGLLA